MVEQVSRREDWRCGKEERRELEVLTVLDRRLGGVVYLHRIRGLKLLGMGGASLWLVVPVLGKDEQGRKEKGKARACQLVVRKEMLVSRRPPYRCEEQRLQSHHVVGSRNDGGFGERGWEGKEGRERGEGGR